MLIIRIKERRTELKITQAQLAELVGVGQSTISEIESGRHQPTIELALLIARALQTSVDNIFEIK